MKSKEIESEFYIRRGKEVSFSGKDVAGLIQDTLAKDNSFRFKAKGFSMAPFIKDGDVITISRFFNSSIGFGRPVAFIHPQTEKLIVHRVVGKNGDYYLIRGDNVIEPDGLISKESILGYITRIERNGKKIFLGLGPERIPLGLLSRCSLLFPLLHFLRRFARPVIKKLKDE